MQIINITEAKSHFSAVINQAIAREEFIIQRMGQPVAKITPYTSKKRDNILGLMQGQASIPDDFNEWPDEESEYLGVKN